MTALVKTHLAWHGRATDSTVQICAMAVDANGALTAVVNGLTYPLAPAVAPTLTASTTLGDGNNFGVGSITVTGLAPNSRTPATVYIGATAIATMSLRTRPSVGDAFTLIASGCTDDTHTSPWGDSVRRRFPNACAFFGLGDQVYPDSPEGGGTVTAQWNETYQQTSLDVYNATPSGAGTSAAKDTAYVSGILAHHRVYHRALGVTELMHTMEYFELPDDHDQYCGNDRAEGFIGSTGDTGWNYYQDICVDQDDALHYQGLGDEVRKVVNLQNVPNTDSGADPAWPSSPHPYWRTTYGDVEVFCLDLCTYRQSPDLHPAEVITALGTLQYNWIVEKAHASTAAVLVMMMPKELWSVQDGWKWAPEERAAFIAAMSNIQKPIIYLSADTHLGSIHIENDVVCVTACPAGVGIKNRPNGMENSQEKWRDLGLKTDTTRGRYFYAALERFPGEGRTRVSLVSHTGEIPWYRDWYDGSRITAYPVISAQAVA